MDEEDTCSETTLGDDSEKVSSHAFEVPPDQVRTHGLAPSFDDLLTLSAICDNEQVGVPILEPCDSSSLLFISRSSAS